VYRTNRSGPSTDPYRKAEGTFIQTTPLRLGKCTAFDWTAVSEANCEVILASRRRLIKGATFCTGEMLSRALGMNLNKGETSSWGRRHPHSRGRDYNAIIFPPGADSSGGRHISVTPVEEPARRCLTYWRIGAMARVGTLTPKKIFCRPSKRRNWEGSAGNCA